MAASYVEPVAAAANTAAVEEGEGYLTIPREDTAVSHNATASPDRPTPAVRRPIAESRDKPVGADEGGVASLYTLCAALSI